jgi:ligand-binding SRPBCC domain-containing protein
MNDLPLSLYEREIYINRPPQEVFDFCLQGDNFQRIFPERITPTRDTTDTVVRPGGSYSFRHWVGNVLPVRWDVDIVDYEHGQHYVDQQRRGPFRHFRHTHRCVPEGAGTRYLDRVEFASLLGTALDEQLVRRRLDKIFTYRQQEMKRLLEDEAG